MRSIQVIDSHTGGEPTRVVVSGGPDLGSGPLEERVRLFREHHDLYRSAVVCEPRGSDVVVGALLVEPVDPTCLAGVIYFNNAGYLGMCGHGTIGVAVTLAHLGRMKPGEHRLETPVGVVTVRLHQAGAVSVDNIASFRKAKGVTVDVPGHGSVTGDVAWGGNWFFLVDRHDQQVCAANIPALTSFAASVRQAVAAAGFPEADHIELFAQPAGPAAHSGAHSQNFVLCPGDAYDRSPCGTGTSAKLACLAADGKLPEGQEWLQASVIGSTFSAHYRWLDRDKGEIAPTITGTAHITAEARLILEPTDPFCWGIRR